MLGVVPVRRKTTKSVLGYTAWNLLVLSPFVIAYWILTETNYNPSYDLRDPNDPNLRSCFAIPWSVANFARWAFLGCCIYQLASLPLNLCCISRSRKIGRETSLTHWMQMGDVLHWAFNWALFFYIVTALANRAQCPDGRLTGLFWANVFISTAFALVGLILGVVALAKFITRMLREIREEARLRAHEGVDVVVARGGIAMPMKQGGVEILEVRKTNAVVDDRNRIRPTDIMRHEQVVDKGDTRVMDNGIAAGELKKEEQIIQRREENIREREVVNRSDPRYMVRDERLDVEDTLPSNANNIRTHDIHASQPRKF